MDSDLPVGFALTRPGCTYVAEVPPAFGRVVKMEVRGDRLLITTENNGKMIISCRLSDAGKNS